MGNWAPRFSGGVLVTADTNHYLVGLFNRAKRVNWLWYGDFFMLKPSLYTTNLNSTEY